MARRRRAVFVLTALVLVILVGSDYSDARFYNNPVDCYALLVVAANDTNTTIHRNLDPVDVNGSLCALVRCYKALIDAGYEDSKIIVLYCSGGLQPNWSEKKNAKYVQMLKKKHFKRQNMDANKANIQSAVASIKEKLDDNDQFVFWINTHGAANGTLMMAPRGQWTTGEIQTTFTGLKSNTNYLLFDSCFSGQILDKCNINNAFMYSTTGSNSPGWVDRNFSNCAYFLECKLEKKLDKDKDGIVDCEEAFQETYTYAKDYEPKLKEYMKTKYKPPKPMPPGIADKSSIIPKMKLGSTFAIANLGPGGGEDKSGSAKAKKPKRKKPSVDPGKALMKKAALYEQGKDWVTVIDIYEKVKAMGEGSRYSKEATQKLDKLLAKKEVKKEYDAYMKRKQIEEDYAMAESYALAGRYEEVIEYCEKVIKATPGSSMAKKAEILLDWTKEMQRLTAQEKENKDK